MTQTFATFDIRPLWLSIQTAGSATVIVFTLGILAAWATCRSSSRVKFLLDACFTLPLVLPPTVVGFFLLVLFGNATPVGRFFIDHGIRLVFSWPATVIAATVVSFPLMYKTVRSSLEQIDPNIINAGRTLGLSELTIFLRVVLPLCWPAIASGVVLSFARALGEFGATLFVAGNFPGITQTMPIAVYFAWAGGNLKAAGIWVIIIALIAFICVFGINKYIEHLDVMRRMRMQR